MLHITIFSLYTGSEKILHTNPLTTETTHNIEKLRKDEKLSITVPKMLLALDRALATFFIFRFHIQKSLEIRFYKKKIPRIFTLQSQIFVCLFVVQEINSLLPISKKYFCKDISITKQKKPKRHPDKETCSIKDWRKNGELNR